MATEAEHPDGVPFDPMCSFLEETVRPRLLELRKASLMEWCRILHNWSQDDAKQIATFDTIRFERLADFACQAAKDVLQNWDPRFSFQVIRSLPHSVIACACQTMFDDMSAIFQVVRALTAAALNPNGKVWQRMASTDQTAMVLTAEDHEELQRQLPTILGRTIGACHLLTWAQYWYRWAGKGRQIKSITSFSLQAAEESISAWSGQGILVIPSVELTEAPLILEAVNAYERRKRVLVSSAFRSGLLEEQASDKPTFANTFWWAIPQSPARPPLPVWLPSINKTFPAPNWLPIPDFKWRGMIRWMEKFFGDRLREKFGFTGSELELCLHALALVVARQSQCCWLEEGKWHGQPALVMNSRAEVNVLDLAAGNLVSILQRGSLRNPCGKFRATLADELQGLGAQEPIDLAHRFFDKFRGVPIPHGLPEPILFVELDEQTCVLDLSVWQDFCGALLTVVTSGDGDVGTKRGRIFEDQMRKTLIERLSLNEDNIPWVAGRDVIVGGKNLGDVDFCFALNGVLFNLDAKSWQRTTAYHIGHYHAIQDRQKALTKEMLKADSRGKGLMELLEARGLHYSANLTFLVVAMPEYVAPDRPDLCFGRSPHRPRVITVDELCALVADEVKLEETLYAASQ